MGVPYSPLLVAPLVSLKSLTMSELSAFGSDIDILLCSVEEGIEDILWFLKLITGELGWEGERISNDCWIRPAVETGICEYLMKERLGDQRTHYSGIDPILRLSHLVVSHSDV